MKLNMQMLFIVLVLSTGVHTQAQIRLDSLYQVIKMKDTYDVDRIKLLNEYARHCYYNQNPGKAFKALREAKRVTEELDYQEGMVMYYLTLSIIHRDSEMTAYYQKKADWISERTDEESPTYEKYVLPENRDFNYEGKLIDGFDTLVSQFTNEEDKELLANIFWLRAIGHYALSHTESAYNSLSEAINVFKEIDELFPIILATRYQMSLLVSQGKEEEAKEREQFLVDLVAKSQNHNRMYLVTSAMGDNYSSQGRYALAIEYYLKSLEEAERVGDLELMANIQLDLGTAYESLELNNKAVEHYEKGLSAVEELGDTVLWQYANGVIVFPLIALGNYEQAKMHMKLASTDSLSNSLNSNQKNFPLVRQLDAQGQLLMHQGQYVEAIPYFLKANKVFVELSGFEWALPYIKLYLTECYFNIGDYSTAVEYGLACFELTDETRVTAKASLLLSEIYSEMNNLPLAYQYSKMHIDIKSKAEQLDELNRLADAEIRSIIDKSQSQIADLEKENTRNEQESRVQKIWIFSIAGALISAIILTLVLYKNNKNKQKANALLSIQKEEIEATLEKLGSTQTQLIHSEKMASLGELTAGIAHEIQNPLNFVNNFSEVNSELIDELIVEVKEGNTKGIEEIANDLKANEDKIAEHGERASSIVKGMLQHSRTGTGDKELTDLNAMADEYLRLSYHGLRAKDKSFNADFKLDLDDTLPPIKVVPQDIGRVLLNLINNAFQAVNGKDNPVVEVSTKNLTDKIEIRVKDNGPGIPDDIKDKIFEPFFTTKPTGQGTGLGLSMSYDIITKGHGGELKVESKEGKGSEFIITLPRV